VEDVTDVTFRSDVTVQCVKHCAADSDVVWSARVSTAGERSLDELEKDPTRSRGLISYLVKNSHGSPFEHSSMTFFISAPIFVFREFHRHRTMSYNEESGRYRELQPVFYVPSRSRKLIQEGQPGHYQFKHGTAAEHELVLKTMTSLCRQAYDAYQQMLKAGVAREVARMVLPLSIYSSMYVTCNARSLMHFLSLRTSSEDATVRSYPQREIEMVAEKLEAEWQKLMPLTHDVFQKNGRQAP
jgi:thymidylate synthase (FAD)